MAFDSLLFITKALPVIILLYFIVPQKYKNATLFVISLILYAWAEPKYLLLLLIILVFNYWYGIMIDKQKDTKRKILLIEALIINIGVLFYFKYYNSFLEAITAIDSVDIVFKTIAVPLGIAFFMLQIISYQIDIYNSKIEADKNFVSFSLGIVFFPKMIMGPIIDNIEWQEQINNHPFSGTLFNVGAKRFIIGLSQKVILANTFTVLWDTMQQYQMSMATAWLSIVVYGLVIYFNFSGYSHMAIGLANLFGFNLNQNFNYPFSSRTVIEFWNRWLIPVGDWFKKYVYIPLGGNQVNKRRQAINILLVWGLVGFWFGGNINFVLWGLYFGILVIIEKYFLNREREHWSNVVNMVITFILVSIGWVFFVSNDVNEIINYLGKLININTSTIIDHSTLWYIKTYAIYFIVAVLAVLPIATNSIRNISKLYPKTISAIINLSLVLLFALCIAYMIFYGYQPFIYT